MIVRYPPNIAQDGHLKFGATYQRVNRLSYLGMKKHIKHVTKYLVYLRLTPCGNNILSGGFVKIFMF
jgi:hypothetical protein